jgi:hypothetical protein
MPEIVGLLTDDHGTITHLIAEDESRLLVAELADRLANGEDWYVTFDDEKRYKITIVGNENMLEPTVDDPDGVRTIWDLPREEDPEEDEITEMFDELDTYGEFDQEGFQSTEQSEDTV